MIIRNLRDITRARTILSREHSSTASPIQKALKDATIKLASVVSITSGKSGRARLQAIVEREESAEQLADLARALFLSTNGRTRNLVDAHG